MTRSHRDVLRAEKEKAKQNTMTKFLRWLAMQTVNAAKRAALYTNFKKVANKTGNRSSYFPHQGKQECARRVRQMRTGFLKV